DDQFMLQSTVWQGSDVSQNTRNMTNMNVTLNDSSDLTENEFDQLNITEHWIFSELFGALLQTEKLPDSNTFSYQCRKDLALFSLAWSRKEPWTLSMYDSMGKPLPGLLSGTMTWSGHLDQCVNTHVTYSKLSHDRSPAEIRTRFCAVYITLPKWLSERMRSFNIPFPVAVPSVIADICTLSGCSEDDLHGLFQKYVEKNSRRDNITITKVRCLTEKNVLEDAPAVVSLCVIFLLILLALAGTVFEVILRARRRGLNSARNPNLTGCGDLNMSTLSSIGSRVLDTHVSNRGANPGQEGIPEAKDDREALSDSLSDDHSSVIEKLDRIHISFPETQVADGTKSVICDDSVITDEQSVNNAITCSDTDASQDLSSDVNAGINEEQDGSDNSASQTQDAASTNGGTQDDSVVADEHSVNNAVTLTLLQRLLVACSIRRNTTNVFGKGHEDMLFCLNGIRVLSNSWIVLGSYFMTIFSNPAVVENHVTISKFGQSFWAQFLINTGLAADTFFIMSGALNMYNLMKAKAKSRCKSMLKVMSRAEYCQNIIHRLFRIVPCHYMSLMIHTNLSRYLGTGRELRQQADSSEHCRNHWWSNVLFVSNFHKAHEMCMPWSYYLVNDLQMSLLSPLVTIPLLCRPVLGFSLISCLVVLQIVSVLAINTPINGNSMRTNTTSYFSEVQVKPYCRAGVYAIGLGLGYFLYSGDKKVRLRK
ncbi:unnamed protein product, partial [Candidula unifasciata]